MVIGSLKKGKEGASVTGDKTDVPGGPRSRVPLFTPYLSQAGPFIIIRTLFMSRVILLQWVSFYQGK